MSSSVSAARGTEGGRLGGARADFVASLGRKVHDARELLVALEDDPSSRATRDELRRRLHALGAGARLLRFEAMGRALQETLAVLDRGAQSGGVREQDLSVLAQALEDLPALAWSESPPREAPPESTDGVSDAPASPTPLSVLVVGNEDLADALTEDAALRSRPLECERTEDLQTALELARAYAPDVLLVDADVPQMSTLVEALLEDPLTEPVPIVVVGSFRAAEDTARFVALGVARALPKPVAPEVLRRTCEELIDAREGRTIRVTLGEPTLEQLAVRLAEELKGALLESVEPHGRSCRIPLGEGTEVLGALWGAIARVQEIVSLKTGGVVRFGGDAPEGAIALAPWLHQEVAAAERTSSRGRGSATDVRLDGRRVVVADDDPGVTWFISDLLRTAGCDVHEALDGEAALETAFRVQPELVVSDILMPRMDGFALCRALRRDVALRDAPVILLSWKEDLLQRVRELGASAAAYMRKESDSRAILARVREVLRPRARVEMRLRGEGEIRGRLDGLTPRLLLELVCSVRKDARVAVRDATYFYEVEIRGGAPRKATRTASDGSYQSGERALAGLLGVGAARFVVTPTTEALRGDLTGSLFEQLSAPIAAARGALAATTAARTMHVEKVKLDERILEEYLAATPNPTNALIRQLARGTSPRHILLAGEVSPSLLEDVLADLAIRGAIRAVEGPGGADLLTPAVETAMAVIEGAGGRLRSAPPNARASALPPPARIGRPHSRRPEYAHAAPPPPAAGPSAPASPASDPDVEADAIPSSLEDAVMRELSDRSPVQPSVRSPGSDPPPIVEPSALRPRSSNPPSGDDPPESLQPSIPPDAIVPEAPADELGSMSRPPPPEDVPVEEEGPVSVAPPSQQIVPDESGSLIPDTAVSVWRSRQRAAVLATPAETAAAPEPAPSVDHAEEASPAEPYAKPTSRTEPLPVPPGSTRFDATLPPAPRLPSPEPLKPGRKTSPWGLLAATILFLGLGFGVGAAWRALNGGDSSAPAEPSIGPGEQASTVPSAPASAAKTSESPAPQPSVPGYPSASASASSGSSIPPADSRVPSAATYASSAPATPATPPPAARPRPVTGVTGSAASSTSPSSSAAKLPPTEREEIPPGAEVPPGFGLLEVTAPSFARIRIDGAVVGSGPMVSSVVSPGYHDVRIENGGREESHVIDVRAGKVTRISSARP